MSELRRSVLLLFLSIISMLVALLIGIFRLMSEAGVSYFLYQLYPLHSLIMIYGFISGMIMTERVAGIELITSKKLTYNFLMPLLALLGSFLLSLGYALAYGMISYAGSTLLLVSSLLFSFFLIRLFNVSREKSSILMMCLSSLCLIISSFLSYFTLPLRDLVFVQLMLGFPVFFILGERIELMKLTGRMKMNYTLLLSLLPLPYIFSLLSNFFLASYIVLAFSFLSFFVLEYSSRSLRTPFQSYVFKSVTFAYIFGLFGALSGVLYNFINVFALYDISIHGLTIGFIGYMFLAHGPIILPSILNRSADYSKLRFFPHYLLAFAIVTRFTSLFFLDYGLVFSYLASISGWLVLLSALSFIVIIRSSLLIKEFSLA